MTKYNRIGTINFDTGELYNTQLIEDETQITGNKLITEKQNKRNKKYKDKAKNLEEMSEFIQANEGAFIHLIYKYGYPLMDKLQAKCGGNKDNIHIIRFIQLATYTTFGGNLFDKGRHRIKKSSLKNIWDTSSRNSINETYNLLMECGYIYETEEGYIMINEDIIVKGAIDNFKKLHKEDNDLTYTRLFVSNVQDMYIGTDPKARKQLANLFKVLPYINFKHNVFCMNPTEQDENKLQLLNWKDLATLCGYNDTNKVNRFKKDLWTLSVYGYDVIGEFKTKSGMAICINPKVYYGGNNVEDVKRMYTLFSMVQNNN